MPMYEERDSEAGSDSLSQSSRPHLCPMCNGGVERVRRRRVDRLVSLFTPVRRYRCRRKGWGCEWEGNVRRLHPVDQENDQKH